MQEIVNTLFQAKSRYNFYHPNTALMHRTALVFSRHFLMAYLFFQDQITLRMESEAKSKSSLKNVSVSSFC